jgi:hypothetical protein
MRTSLAPARLQALRHPERAKRVEGSRRTWSAPSTRMTAPRTLCPSRPRANLKHSVISSPSAARGRNPVAPGAHPGHAVSLSLRPLCHFDPERNEGEKSRRTWSAVSTAAPSTNASRFLVAALLEMTAGSGAHPAPASPALTVSRQLSAVSFPFRPSTLDFELGGRVGNGPCGFLTMTLQVTHSSC